MIKISEEDREYLGEGLPTRSRVREELTATERTIQHFEIMQKTLDRRSEAHTHLNKAVSDLYHVAHVWRYIMYGVDISLMDYRIGMSVRSANCLSKIGIKTLQALLQIDLDYVAFPLGAGFGEKCRTEVQRIINKYTL